ncbi:efflux transporter outer membrane subunit [Methyloparacoccus murrellii]
MSRALALLLAALGLAGCMVGPDYRLPEVGTPGKYAGARDHHNIPPPDAWWTVFKDPVLDRLIREAAAFNLDIRQTGQRILAARAERQRTIATGLPSLQGRANASQRRNDFITGGGGLSNPAAGGYFGNNLIDIIQAGFDVQWEIDPAGGLFRRIESAQAMIEAEQDYRRAVLVSLLGEVARLYIDLRANQQQMAITRANLATQEDTLQLTMARAGAGLDSQQEVAQQQAQLETTRSQLPAYEIAARQDAHALAVLLGKSPDTLLYLLEMQTPVPAAPTDVIADLPSELLRRRPDILQAERQLAAATADVGTATAQLYPKLNLTGFLGLQNTRLSDFTPVGKSWAMAGGISTPIFNWGRIQAEIDKASAQQQQALLAYQQSILTAFREVEDALVAYQREQDRRRALSASVTANALAVTLSEERYLRGLTAFLNVLEAQRALYLAQSSLVASNARIATSLVALYKALGGGWQPMEPPPHAETGPG